MGTIFRFVVTALIVMFLAYILPGVHVAGFVWALVLALILAILNAIVRPILVFLTLPATIFTLGLFLLVINAIIILIASWLLAPNFHVDGFWWALIFSVLLSLAQSILGGTGSSRD